MWERTVSWRSEIHEQMDPAQASVVLFSSRRANLLHLVDLLVDRGYSALLKAVC